ncbi:heparinase II/III family protein [Ralstonia pseudosolanacearum]
MKRPPLVLARTAFALGLPSLARALRYRVGVKLGLNPVRRLRAEIPAGAFFSESRIKAAPEGLVGHAAEETVAVRYFGWYEPAQHAEPDWHRNPFNGARVNEPSQPWWQIADFDPTLGDIKAIWEASRFDWVLVLAQQAVRGRPQAMTQLNAWLTSWARANPPYLGPNWKCGQEAAIRVMHLAMAALVLGQHFSAPPALMALVRTHLQRIAPTLGYAIAQDNNHGTSEAAALFIGGSWLAAQGDPDGRRWHQAGSHWLENRARKLIADDGSFSQHSVMYHRLMLDTYSMAEVWRRHWSLPAFSAQLQARLGVASNWLYQMIDRTTGDAPNLGANDGARLLPLTAADHRDFRPSVQLACALFQRADAFGWDGEWSDALRWLGVPRPEQRVPPARSTHMEAGGYGLLRYGRAFALFNLPHHRHRPSQADALHVDFWLGGKNLLRDAGSFSYASAESAGYFSGTASHNTVQFDQRDQMPRLSRFLFGAWLKARNVEPVKQTADGVTCAAGYRDWQGASHHRALTLGRKSLRVVDRVGGFRRSAVLRWRLCPGAQLSGNVVQSEAGNLTVTADVPIRRIELTSGRESRYYLQTESIPVLEVELDRPGTLTTEFQFLP